MPFIKRPRTTKSINKRVLRFLLSWHYHPPYNSSSCKNFLCLSTPTKHLTIKDNSVLHHSQFVVVTASAYHLHVPPRDSTMLIVLCNEHRRAWDQRSGPWSPQVVDLQTLGPVDDDFKLFDVHSTVRRCGGYMPRVLKSLPPFTRLTAMVRVWWWSPTKGHLPLLPTIKLSVHFTSRPILKYSSSSPPGHYFHFSATPAASPTTRSRRPHWRFHHFSVAQVHIRISPAYYGAASIYHHYNHSIKPRLLFTMPTVVIYRFSQRFIPYHKSIWSKRHKSTENGLGPKRPNNSEIINRHHVSCSCGVISCYRSGLNSAFDLERIACTLLHLRRYSQRRIPPPVTYCCSRLQQHRPKLNTTDVIRLKRVLYGLCLGSKQHWYHSEKNRVVCIYYFRIVCWSVIITMDF